jgi:hypothetical protein
MLRQRLISPALNQHAMASSPGLAPRPWLPARAPARQRARRLVCTETRLHTQRTAHDISTHPRTCTHPSHAQCSCSMRMAFVARPASHAWPKELGPTNARALCLLLPHADLIPYPIVARWSSASRHGAPRRTCAIVGTDGRRRCCCRRGSRGRGPRGSYPGVAHRKVHARHIQCLVHRVVDADDAEAAPSTISSVPEALAQHVDAVRVSGSHCRRRHYWRCRLFLRGPIRHHLQPAAQLAVLRLELRDLVLVLVLRLDGAAAAMPTAAAAAAARCGQPHRNAERRRWWGGCVCANVSFMRAVVSE